MNQLPTRRRALRALPIAALLLAGGCRRDAVFPKAPVVLISIDTLRSDRLPAYGATTIRTPAIDALRADGILYQRAYSQIPLTLPSHVTILTGLLPGHHGVRDNVGYALDTAGPAWLPRILHQRGYATGGFVSSYVLRGETGLAQVFDAYDSTIELRTEEALGNSQRPGGETAEKALAWLDSVPGAHDTAPFFLFLHLYEPHSPYAPPEPYRSEAPTGYDGEIVTADAIVGHVLDELKRRGVYDRALIVLLSDHGEGLGDHGEREHGVLLYREALQVPLIVKLPGGRNAGGTVDKGVGLVDVAPSILRWLAVPSAPGDGLALPLADESAPVERDLLAETYYPRLHFGWSALNSLIRGERHFIEAPHPELYALDTDPAERTNLVETDRRSANTLRAALAPRIVEPAAPAAVPAETAAALASLGYLQGATAARGTADPKDRIASLTLYDDALKLLTQGQPGEAIVALQRVLAENPDMVDAWDTLGRTLLAQGRASDAKQAYEAGLKAAGGRSSNVALGLADALLVLGDSAAATALAQSVVELAPSSAHAVLRQIALQRGDLETAEREARAAAAARGARVGPLVALAEVLAARGKAAEALPLVEQAEREALALHSKTADGLRTLRATLTARLGRVDEAERLFLDELAAAPARLKTYSQLAGFYVAHGRSADAVSTLQRMTEANPTPEAYAEAVRALTVLGAPGDAEALLRYARSRFPGAPALADPRPSRGPS